MGQFGFSRGGALGALALSVALVSGAQAQRGGEFIPYYDAPANPAYQGIADAMQEIGYMDEFAGDLNGLIALPRDIEVGFGECGQPNAFYSPSEHKITMCYELAAYFLDMFAGDGSNPERQETAALGAISFTLFHELGHALIDVLDLPATGMEEDAVDQLAATILLDVEEFGPAGPVAVMDAAMWFFNNAQAEAATGFDQLAFHNEHSLNPVRYFNLVCWVYGSDSRTFAGMAGPVLPDTRAERCPAEYQRFTHAWERLLEPYLN